MTRFDMVYKIVTKLSESREAAILMSGSAIEARISLIAKVLECRGVYVEKIGGKNIIAVSIEVIKFSEKAKNEFVKKLVDSDENIAVINKETVISVKRGYYEELRDLFYKQSGTHLLATNIHVEQTDIVEAFVNWLSKGGKNGVFVYDEIFYLIYDKETLKNEEVFNQFAEKRFKNFTLFENTLTLTISNLFD